MLTVEMNSIVADDRIRDVTRDNKLPYETGGFGSLIGRSELPMKVFALYFHFTGRKAQSFIWTVQCGAFIVVRRHTLHGKERKSLCCYDL